MVPVSNTQPIPSTMPSAAVSTNVLFGRSLNASDSCR